MSGDDKTWKRCASCGDEYIRSEQNFYADATRPDRLGAYCRHCKLAYEKRLTAEQKRLARTVAEKLDDTSATIWRIQPTNTAKVYRALLLYPEANFLDLQRITNLKADSLSAALAKLYDANLARPA